MALIIIYAFPLLLHGVLGELICEQLPADVCAYSIATSGHRCLLDIEYRCKTSEIVVDTMNDWIETDACVRSCGLRRKTVGISSDSLLRLTTRLCSHECYRFCPNIIDLYSNLAWEKGIHLPTFCKYPCLERGDDPPPRIYGVTLHAIVDACHSGTILLLEHVYNRQGDVNRPLCNASKHTDSAFATSLSAYLDNQVADYTSAFKKTIEA